MRNNGTCFGAAAQGTPIALILKIKNRKTIWIKNTQMLFVLCFILHNINGGNPTVSKQLAAADMMAEAETACSSARLILEHGDAASAVNRAYYAMFHAARAALLDGGRTC